MAECLFPYYRDTWKDEGAPKRQAERWQPVPCGKCPECLKRRSAHWAFRMSQEQKNWKYSYFVTLTYDNEHLPITPNKLMTLKKEDYQLFFKRLRKNSQTKVMFYIAGEYGGKTHRPHYHAIIFSNKEITDFILKAWYYGAVYFGDVQDASVRYTVGYLEKGGMVKFGDENKDDRVEEFSSMSRGIGKSYLTPEVFRRLKSKAEAQYIWYNGHKISIPRYFKKKLFDAYPCVKEEYEKASQRFISEKPSEEYIRKREEDRFNYIRNEREKKRKNRR